MKFERIYLTDSNRTPFALSNEFPDTFALADTIEDSKDAAELVRKLPSINSYIKKFSLDRETEDYIRIKCIAHMCDNEYILVIKK